MPRLRDLSLRYKIPLRGTFLVLVTATLVTGSLIVREYDELKQDLEAHAKSLGRVLANTLVGPIIHDDVWRVFEIVSSPAQPGNHAKSVQQAEVMMVWDARYRIYVSTRPNDYPMLADVAAVHPDLRAVLEAVRANSGGGQFAKDVEGSDMLYVVTPIVADGVALGTLVAAYAKSAFLPRFYAIARRAGLVTLLVLLVLLPASWYWGQRFARPLTQLVDNMGRVGATLPEAQELEVYEARDEVGQLGSAFRRMVEELREKQALEREVMQSERLAAVGRLAAGIAHEINNPLAGMLNAIDTFKHHGKVDPVSARTVSLIERGLRQIKDTVAALLVEARVESHPLTRQDVEDTRTLVLADAQRKRARFEWANEIEGNLPLPSTLVRQILINLLLNAVNAIEDGGRLSCRVARREQALHIEVANDGAHIAAEQMRHLFEPFASQREARKGLGLWVTYQIVRQLGGEIEVRSQPGQTVFAARLPIQEESA